MLRPGTPIPVLLSLRRGAGVSQSEPVTLTPRSFVSGAKVDLDRVLQAYNREEFHHLMSRSFLKGRGMTVGEINRLANFVIISAADNKTLGGVAPSIYKAKMPFETIDDILDAAACPHSLFDDHYGRFLSVRADRLVTVANALMGLVPVTSSSADER